MDRMRWVRPFISIAMAGGIIYGFIVGKITPTDFLITAALAVGWWYYKRDQEKTTSTTTTSTSTKPETASK